jgi:DNA-binding response OmpR family regulator
MASRRRESCGKSSAIIGISASALDAEKKRFLAAGVDAFIAKPFREQELYQALARHAGVLFETGAGGESSLQQEGAVIPTLEKMSPEWREEFRLALARKNITRIKGLVEEAKGVDPALASWLLERTLRYDLDALMRL